MQDCAPLAGEASDRAQSAELVRWMKLVGAGVTVAEFVAFDAANRFLVAMPNSAGPVPALSTIGLAASDAGAKVVVALEGGDASRPVIIGRVRNQAPATEPQPLVRVDAEKLLLQADREIELRCGDASIVLTRAGKVLIHGAYVLSRSRGANRIKGAYVDIN
jgi:Domain of unknown function (DUF6484)